MPASRSQRSPPVLHAGGPVGEEPGGLHAGGDVGQRGGAGSGALPARRQRLLVGGLRHAHRARGDVDAPGLQPAHDVPEAAALHAADQVRRRAPGNPRRAAPRCRRPCSRAWRWTSRPGSPGAPFSTMKHDMPRWRGCARRVGEGEQGEGVALAAVGDEHLRAGRSGSGRRPARATVRMACTSEPACGSVRQRPPRVCAAARSAAGSGGAARRCRGGARSARPWCGC